MEHPIVVLPPGLGSGFTLVVSANGNYELTFSNGMGSAAHNGSATARVYIVAFASSVSNPIWWYTLQSSPNVGRELITETATFSPAQISGATRILVGAWWDDGTFPNSQNGTVAYFQAHPEGGGHHSVGIIPG
jgi:hypothetical protein